MRITVKPVCNSPVFSGHPVYYCHRTTCLVQMYFLQSRPVCSSHPACNGHHGIFQWLTLTGLTVIKSSKEKWFDLLSNSLNYFLREMYTVLRSVLK